MSEPLEKVILQSSDGTQITVDREVADRSVLLKNLIEDLGEENVGNTPVPLPNVSSSAHRRGVPRLRMTTTELIRSTGQ